MSMVWAFVGLLLVGAVAWQVFSDLFHPAGTAALSDWVGRVVFNNFKRFPRSLPLAGPVALVTQIALWVAGLVLGFAFLYLYAYPGDFRTSTSEVPADSSRFLAVLYFSFETLITLGYGDVVPHSMVTRVVSATEGLIGFAILTASVSSIVLLYAALARMRLLARGVFHLVEAERACGTSVASTGSDVILSSLARDVTRARIDLVHFPIVYYFASHDPNASVARWLGDLVRFAREAGSPERSPRVRFAAKALDGALHDFAAIVEERFLHTRSDNRDIIFDALRRDQLVGGS